MTEEQMETDKQFGIIAESEGYEKQLVLLNLSFGRLMDDIVVPYDNNESFFIDGVPVTKSKIKRIKIIELGEYFHPQLIEMERGMTRGDAASKKIYGDQYETRFEHIVRKNSVDVTAQVLKAYNEVIKPSIKDYIPNRQELINTATKVFVEGMKLLGS